MATPKRGPRTSKTSSPPIFDRRQIAGRPRRKSGSGGGGGVKRNSGGTRKR